MSSLPDALYQQVEQLSEQGNLAFDAGRFGAAIAPWQAALDLLPAPGRQWEAWTWLHTAIGDAYWQLGNFPAARTALLDALTGPGAQENPFVHYRLGQAAHRTGRDDEAREHLLRAYMLDGQDIFEAEADGARWLQWLRDAGLVD